MEGAAAFTTLSGAGLVAIGLSALGAGVLAGSSPGPTWLRVWVAEAALAIVVGVLATLRKTGAAGLPILSGPLRKFGLALAAPSLGGAVLTVALAQQGSYALLQTSDGNLSVHARKLEDAGYVTCSKTFENRRPRTDYRLTARGRQALGRYLGHMEAIIRSAKDTLGP